MTWYKTYKAAYAQVKEQFRELSIVNITPFDIDKYFKKLKANKYSHKYVATRKSVLNMIFEYAFVRGYVNDNFISSVPIPSGLGKKARKAPSEDDIKIVTSNYEGDDFLFYFLVYTGLRMSEACALTDEDIDFDNNLIYINKKNCLGRKQTCFETSAKNRSRGKSRAVAFRTQKAYDEKF